MSKDAKPLYFFVFAWLRLLLQMGRVGNSIS